MTHQSKRLARSRAALVLGLDSHGLSVVRALADAGVTVYAMERNQLCPGATSNRVKRVFPVKDFDAEHLLPALAQARADMVLHQDVALLAINDRQVAVIARNLERVLADYLVAWAPEAETILTLQRKDTLERIALAQGLHYPRSRIFDRPVIESNAIDLQFPVILKPVQPLSSFKTLLLQDATELAPALERHARDLPILAQEYVTGGDESIFFGALLLDRGRAIYGVAGRKLASYPPARGQTTVAETVDEPEILKLTEQFFAGMNLSGPVSLELKRDEAGRHWVIEPTVGRTDFWSELCVSAGFNQPYMEFQLACGLPIDHPVRTRKCVWYDTEREPLGWLRLAWRESTWRPRGAYQAFPYWGRGDWRPVARAARQFLTDRLGRRLWS